MKNLASPGRSPQHPDIILDVHDLVVKRPGLRRDKLGDRVVLEVENLAIRQGEVLAVIGPNGAGKSTLLLTLGRLLQPDGGQILYRGQPVETEDPLSYRRRIGLVLQDPLLLDATVYDNVALGLRFRGLGRDEVKRRVEDWLARLGVSHLRDRRARRLSGGEAQRVNLARAFALQPEMLLLDEPFSALDAPTRALLLEDFHALLAGMPQARGVPLTTIFITHDLDEALFLGDRVAVLLGGRLRQVGAPDEVFNAPADQEVAAFVGVETVLSGLVISSRDGLVSVQVASYRLEAVGELPAGRPVLLCLRPEDITLLPSSEAQSPGSAPVSSARNRLAGRIQRLLPHGGALVRVVVDCGFQVVALVTRASAQEMGLEPDLPVMVSFKASAIHLIPR